MAASSKLSWRDIGSAAPKTPKKRPSPTPRAIQAALNDRRPKVLLCGDDRELSELAEDCGNYLRNVFFFRNGAVLIVEGGEARQISDQRFRTEAARYIAFYRRKGNGDLHVGATMTLDEARGIMAASQFTSKLRPLERIYSPRLPVRRSNGSIERLPEGYDAETKIFTVGTPAFREDLTLEEARAAIDDLLSEFDFADGDRSNAVAIAALVGMMGAMLMPEGSRRPAFIIDKNAEGAGASTLASCIVWPLLGSANIRTFPEDEAEMRKVLVSASLDAVLALIFDNIKKTIAGEAIEGFISSSVYGGRLLGTNQSIACPNRTTVIFTANGARETSDMRRRSLHIKLHLGVERAEDRQFRRSITDSVLTELRPRILAAAWALIRHWDSVGRPVPSRSHSAFPEWAQTIGGIVEAAGYTCPFETPQVTESIDEDSAAMRSLVAVMQPERKYNSRELADLCRAHEILPGIVAGSDSEMTRSQRSAWGKVLAKYDNRAVGERRFHIEGKEHSKRFWVTENATKNQSGLHGRMVEHGLLYPPMEKYTPIGAVGNTMYDRATMQPDVTSPGLANDNGASHHGPSPNGKTGPVERETILGGRVSI